MKIKVQIDSVFQEEMLQIQAPSRTPKIQQVVEFVESLDDNQRLKGKKDGETRSPGPRSSGFRRRGAL